MTRIEEERIDEMLADAISERDRPIIGDGSLYDFHPSELVNALTELKELRAQGGVRVKGLEWREESKSWFRASTVLGVYQISHYAGMRSEGFKLEYGGGLTSYLSTLEKAKAAAEADYRNRILSALETEAVEPTVTGWQPIETAPKDNTPVIVAVPKKDRDGFIVGEAYFAADNDDWFWAGSSAGDYYGGPMSEINHHLPTHWQPLPSPPALSSESKP